MKKFITIALIIIMSVSIVACGNNSKNTTTSSSSSATTSSSTTTTKKDDPVTDPTKDFEKVNEPVYVTTDSLNIRTSPEFPDDNSNIYKSFDYGEELTRVGYNETWSKLLIDGTEYYASSKYLTTSKIVTQFDDVTETVYIVGIDTIRLRSKTSLNDEISTTVTFLSRGDEITRTGTALEEDGEGILWSRVELLVEDESGNMKLREGYVNSKYLSTSPEEITTPDIDIEFGPANDTLVVIADSLNLRTYPKFEDASLSGKSASKGDELARIGIASEPDEDGITWSMVVFEGIPYYISSNPAYTEVKENPTATSTTFSLFDGYYSITLPANFAKYSEDEGMVVIASATEAISIAYSGDLGDIEMSAVEYATFLIEALGVETTVTEEEGFVYFSFVVETGAEPCYSVCAIAAGTGNDYYVTTIAGNGNEADLKEAYLEYAKTIKIEAPDAE